MKKRKRKECSRTGCPLCCERARQDGFLHHTGKALLLTASYQVFSVFLATGGAQATQAGLDYTARDSSRPHIASPLSGGGGNGGLPGVLVSCIGCTTGPDNVPCGGTGCTGCTSCTRCTDCTRCTGCTGCTGCTRCTGCTGCTACTGCTGATITQRNHAQELSQQADRLYDAGRYREALDLYLDAKKTWAYWQTDIDRSIANCRAMMQKQAAEALNDEGIAHYKNRDWVRAANAFRQAQELWPGSEVYRRNIGLAEDRKREADEAATAGGMRKDILAFADREPSRTPPADGLDFMSAGAGRPGNIANPQISKLMKEVDSIKVPPPFGRDRSPITFSWFLPGDRASESILFGTDVGVATAEIAFTVAGSALTAYPRLLLATGKTFIAMEDGADIYLVKQNKVYEEALRLLKDRGTAPLFTACVRALREKKPLPADAGPEMVRTARAIIDPRLGNSGRRIAWSAMWSPEAKAAGVGRACMELGGELIGRGTEGLVKNVAAARDPAFKTAIDKIASAEAMLKKTSDAGEKAALEEVIRKANSIMVRSYEAGAMGMGTIGSFFAGEQVESSREKK